MRSWGKEPENVAEALAFYAARMREDAPAEFLADYMAFCWQACEPGMVAAADLNDEVFTEAADRLHDLLAQANQDRYRWTPLDFWRRYILSADYGGEFTFDVAECRAFLEHNPAYFEPSFYLFAVGRDDSVHSLVTEVLKQCEQPTLRNRYVRSFIESTISNRKPDRPV